MSNEPISSVLLTSPPSLQVSREATPIAKANGTVEHPHDQGERVDDEKGPVAEERLWDRWLRGPLCRAPCEPARGRPIDSQVDHPRHYNSHPSGIECIEIVEHMSFNVGNAIKYLWRCDEKGATEQDLRKAAWYIEREIRRRGFSATPVENDPAEKAPQSE